jgi:hypothetical protein
MWVSNQNTIAAPSYQTQMRSPLNFLPSFRFKFFIINNDYRIARRFNHKQALLGTGSACLKGKRKTGQGAERMGCSYQVSEKRRLFLGKC